MNQPVPSKDFPRLGAPVLKEHPQFQFEMARCEAILENLEEADRHLRMSGLVWAERSLNLPEFQAVWDRCGAGMETPEG